MSKTQKELDEMTARSRKAMKAYKRERYGRFYLIVDGLVWIILFVMAMAVWAVITYGAKGGM
jgi:cytoskeletal protein RodZ